MRYFIISKSRDGWGVALDSDLLEEFPDVEQARAHAQGLCELATFREEAFEVLDLSSADVGGSLMARDTRRPH
jgi:hypothetical protein